MTDNYQFDKNSKLFQKFLAMKANKNNESVVPKQKPSETMTENLNKNLSSQYQIPEKHSKRDRIRSIEAEENQSQGPLHVTIDDIEEAASEAINESAVNQSQYPEKDGLKTVPQVKTDPKVLSKEKDIQMPKIEPISESEVENVMPKNERNRQRRTREFRQRPRTREEKIQQKSFVKVEQQISPKVQNNFGINFKPAEEQFEFQRENVEPNFKQEPTIKSEQMNFTLGSKEGEYKKKYQKLNQKYQQIKETLQIERKQNQIFKNDKEAEVQLLKQKYFQLRSKEDTLTTDLKRYKDKVQSESMMRTKFEEEVKELNFRIIQLEEILEGQESNLKKKTDEIAYWKTQNEQLRSQMKEYYAEVETFEEKCKFLQSEGKIVQKDVSHKEQLVEELRKNIATLIQENNIAKDELYKLTIKLYHLQQENMSLRADVLRRQNQQHQNISSIQDSYLKTLATMSPKRSKERPQRYQNITENNEVTRESGPRRKRQFARERAVTKPEPAEKNIQRFAQREEKRQRRTNQPQRHQGNLDNNAREIAARIQHLQNQLDIRSKQKAMNGRLRKEKIEIERELQALIQKQIQ